jgi:hypothetical protein
MPLLSSSFTTLAAAQTLPYAQLRDGLLARRYLTEVAPDGAATVAAELLTAAYLQCLGAQIWPEPAHGHAISATAGRVARAGFGAVRSLEFWTTDPAADATATPITVTEVKPDALVLETVLETVWVRYTLRPIFTTAVLADAAYAAGATAVRAADGHLYLALQADVLGSECADPLKWARVPVLACLAEPTQLLALAEWRQPSDAAYAQAMRSLAQQRLAQPSTL